LAAIWTAIAQRAGATSVHVDETTAPAAAGPDASLPPVTPIEPGIGYSCAGTTMTLVGGPFAYRPDSDQFVDPNAALQVLIPIATQLRANGISATMFGTTATVGEVADRVRFSDERAQAVADMLIDLDVPVPQLHVEGLGSDFPGFAADRDETGRLLPAAAALNRTVRIEFTGPMTCG
jgi:outer membrane protein OmpA-like peptidoglycan-associated protein